MRVFFAFSVLIVIASGQQRCRQTPSKWTGFFYENDFTAVGNEPYVRFAAVDYDATPDNERVRIIEFDELNSPGRDNSFKQEEFYLFKERKGYTYNFNTRECRTTNLEDEFRPFGVINDAEYRGRFWLGVENNEKLGLDVDHFFYSRSDDDSLNHHYSSYWVPVPNTNERTCVPVEQHFINLNGPRANAPSVDARFTFLNITTVTEFPEPTFEIPAACKE